MATSPSADVRAKGKPRGLLELLREDRRTYEQADHRPGFHALVVHRMGHAAMDVVEPAGLSVRLLRKGLRVLSFITQSVYGIEIPWQAQVGRRVVIAHQGGIVIASNTVIGDDCLIRQNVTIGMAAEGGRSPSLGQGVQVGAGAVIVGDVMIGAGAIIGPNAVVTSDVPARARVIAARSRILSRPDDAYHATVEREGGMDTSQPTALEVSSIVRDALGLKAPIEADTPLLSSGVVDSLNLVIVLDALESRYVTQIPAEDVSAESFDTARHIADYLRVRRSQR